ncbi:MAG: Rpn family recombination-promoting nuclease/putative transposase, partial [Treponema sp.]|nr:Rpn family recombination-promoting nuclease/putative transposase [Treponema sp.]
MIEQKSSLRPSPTAILNPRLDINFKAIFTQGTEGSKIALQSFLSSVLERKVKKISLAPNEPPAETPSQMQMAFDVSATFEDGEKADIEIQGRDRDYDYAIRSEAQVARLLSNNTIKGEKWNVKKVYQISVLNFCRKGSDKSQKAWYSMRDENGNKLSGRLNVIYINLPEIKKLVGTPVEKLTPVQKWGLYFSYADDEKRASYIRQLAQSERGIMEAKTIIGRMSQEDANWFRQNSYDTFWRDYNTEMANAREHGLKAGRKKGLELGREEGR